MAKKAVKTEKTDELQMVDLGPSPIGGEDDGEKKTNELPSVEAQVATLTELVAGMATQLGEAAERESRYQTTITQVLSGQRQPETTPQATPEPVKLADPVDDKDGFQKGLVEMIQSTVGEAIATSTAATAMASSAQSQADGLWSDFQTAHPEQAKFPKLVEAVGREKFAEFTARGLDPNAAASVDRRAFLKGVSDSVDQELKTIRGESEEEEETNRTIGVEGGMTTPLTTAGAAKDADEGSFVNEIREIQLKEKLV